MLSSMQEPENSMNSKNGAYLIQPLCSHAGLSQIPHAPLAWLLTVIDEQRNLWNFYKITFA